jgi:hypothetical protein
VKPETLWYTSGMSKGWSVNYRLPSIEEDPSIMEEALEYANSPERILFSEVGETVSVMLERADVDAKKRQIIWEDDARLSITASAQRIRAEHPDYPLNFIEERIINWLESLFAPTTYTPEQLDELDELTAAWVEDHQAQARAAPKG